MIQHALFKSPGPVVAGMHLRGHPRWSVAVDLMRLRVTGRAQGAGLHVFELEVDGVLTGQQFSLIPAGAGDFLSVVALNYVLPANSQVRFKCVSAPDPTEGLFNIGANLEYQAASLQTVSQAVLTVRYVEGTEDVLLFNYDATTKVFTDVSGGLAASRASIVNSPSCTIEIKGDPALLIDSGQVLSVNDLIAIGSASGTGSPRLEFYRGPTRIGTLTRTGTLRVINVTEVPSAEALQGGADRFELYGGGVLSAILGPVNLTAKGLVAPIA